MQAGVTANQLGATAGESAGQANSYILDLTGSSGVHSGNLNATPAIVHSVIMYVMRLLVEFDLPLNEGLLEPVEIRIPMGLLNPPFVDDPERPRLVWRARYLDRIMRPGER